MSSSTMPIDDPDWDRLAALRARFLTDAPSTRTLGDYWGSDEDLAAYDAVFAERIGWKWDALFDELEERGIVLDRRGTLVDFGCGTGIATRRFLARSGSEPAQILLHDRSTRAMGFAARLVDRPSVETSPHLPTSCAPDILLVSHVLGEMNARSERELLEIVARSRTVLWVEPGTQFLSRRLSAIRDRLRDAFDILAPCTHAAPCGALAASDEDWCHFFAAPPNEVFTDPDWVKIGRKLGIDLRSLPYACLVLRAKPPAPANPEPQPGEPQPGDPGAARILGRPRIRPKLARFFTCDREGLREITLFKSRSPAEYKQLKKAPPRQWRK